LAKTQRYLKLQKTRYFWCFRLDLNESKCPTFALVQQFQHVFLAKFSQKEIPLFPATFG
jgi:hypothetical protein